MQRGLYQPVARIGETGHAGIRNQRHVSQRQPLHKLGNPPFITVLVKADQRRIDLIMLQQPPRRPRILRRNQTDLAQYPQPAKGDVFEITDGGADEVEGQE